MSQDPRKLAYADLKNFDPRRKRIEDAIDKRRRDLDAQTFGIYAGLMDACVRHSALIDHLIAHGSTIKPSKMERAVLAALRIGAASYLRGTAAHASVSETVDLLPSNHRARGLVNAVMRRVCEGVEARDLTDEERTLLLKGDEQALAKLVTPTAMPWHNERLIEARYALFPPELSQSLALLSGIPEWLLKRLSKTLETSEIALVCLACASTPALWVRVVSGREEQASSILTKCEAQEIEGAYRIPSARAFTLLHSKAFRDGAVTVQDFSAQLPVQRAELEEGWRCVDLCAAPGGKTCQLSEAVGASGSVIAFDVTEKKLKRVQENMMRMGLSNIGGAFGDGTSVELPGMGEFDCVLVDVPCSNTGVMSRRVELRQRLRESDLLQLHDLQLALIKNAADHLRGRGVLIYSTCSIIDEENGALVREFLEGEGGESSGWQMLDECLTLPQPGEHEGGYYAILQAPLSED